MIPRFKPFLDQQEYRACFSHPHSPVVEFEQAFAKLLQTRHALSFMYGRAAIWALLKANQIQNANIIVPAYTCKVVAEAVVKSDNLPLFVDINRSDYNMDLEQLQETIDDKTRAVIATHLFGHPMDTDALEDIIENAQNRYGHPILLIQDCAHAFRTEWNHKLVANSGAAAIYGFSLSKPMTTILGGMMTTNDDLLYEKLLAYRNRVFLKNPGIFRRVRPLAYLLASGIFFNESIFNLIDIAENLLDRLDSNSNSILSEDIVLPKAFLDQMYTTPAKIGMVQLKKMNTVTHRRRSIADFYRERLLDLSDKYPELLANDTPGATYAYFVARIPDRRNIIQYARQYNVQIGSPLNYCLANLPAYRKYHRPGQQFENAQKSSCGTVNLPNYPGLTQSQQEQVITVFMDAVNQLA